MNKNNELIIDVNHIESFYEDDWDESDHTSVASKYVKIFYQSIKDDTINIL